MAGDAAGLWCVTGDAAGLWTVMSTARTIRRFTAEPVDDATLARCLQAATWVLSLRYSAVMGG